MAGEYDPVKGTVAWFDVPRGYGFITPEDGGENLFVHYSSIKAMGFRSLSGGELVEFVVSVGDDGRRRAVSVTGPGGAYVKGCRYFDGACYRCGEVGHMATDCKSDGCCRRLGPCYGCGAMGHLVKECPDARIESSSPRSNIFKAWKLSDNAEEDIRTVFSRLYESTDSAE
ncbi:cold shock protein 1-like, partial [Phalaenopsis equestris]|uniref:cold shock protein 1-like n=1 Tax=Phalaenopsis equestris TaxID=78828 RepID=UPI0009E364F0